MHNNWLGTSYGDTGFNDFLSVPLFQAATAHVVVRFSTRWTVRGSNPGGGKIFPTHPERHEANPATCRIGTEALSQR